MRKIQDRRRQAIEQIIQEHGPKRPLRPSGEHRIVREVAVRLHRIDRPDTESPGMVGQEAVLEEVTQHPLRLVRRDVGEPVIVILARLFAEVAEVIQKEPREKTDADADLKHVDLLFENLLLIGRRTIREEKFCCVARQSPVVVDEERHRNGVAEERLTSSLTEIELAEVPLQTLWKRTILLNDLAIALRPRQDANGSSSIGHETTLVARSKPSAMAAHFVGFASRIDGRARSRGARVL